MKTGIELIAEERQRQIEKGWDSYHDDNHKYGEIARAAAAYALPKKFRQLMKNGRPELFPWSILWWRPTPNDRIRELAKAGALIAAEIDRLNRLNDAKNN